MMITLLTACGLALSPLSVSVNETVAPTEAAILANTLQIQATTVLLGDGTRIENGIVLIRDGKVVDVKKGGELDDRSPSIKHDGFLTPGMIACQAELGTSNEAYDSTRTMLPEARMANGFRPGHSDFRYALKNGITSVVLSPDERNPIGGVTTVVKTHGAEVISREAHLALSFTTAGLASSGGGFSFFLGEAKLAAESGDLEVTSSSRSGSRMPTSHSGLLREMRSSVLKGTGVLERVRTGKLPVMIEAWDRNEVIRAARFAAENGLKGAVRGLPLGSDPYVVAALKTGGLGAVLGPYGPEQKRRSLESARALAEAGVPFAFALDAPTSAPESLRWTAVAALGAGAPYAAVWKALTKDAAHIAGVQDRVGDLKGGLDADFVLWSGDPLNLASRIEAVYVQGQRVDR